MSRVNRDSPCRKTDRFVSGAGFSSDVATDNGLNTVSIVAYSSGNTACLTGSSGPVVNVRLRIPDDANGDYAITLTDLQLMPVGGSMVVPDDVTATLTVTPWPPEAYAAFDWQNCTLTFYYDNLRNTREGLVFDLNTGLSYPAWRNDTVNATATQVVFHPSFADARPTSTSCWFERMTYLKSITGMQYLNTSEVTSMYGMFRDCRMLSSIDLSNFNTDKVTSMRFMFAGCMILESLDISNFNTANVTNMSKMFYYSYRLVTIYVGDGWSTAAVTNSSNMFGYCPKLVGGMGTTYDANNVDAAYAHIDGGTANPGYFTDKSLLSRGDVDGNGRVNIADVTAMIDYILPGGAQSVNAANADVDGNGIVNIADVTALIDYILSGHWSV